MHTHGAWQPPFYVNPMTRPTILFVSHSAGRYGAEKSLLDLVLGINRDLYNVIVLVPRRGPLTELLGKHGVRYIVSFYTKWIDNNLIPLKAIIRTVINVIALIRLLRILKSHSIGLVYTNTVVIPIGALLSRFLRIPHIWHVREFVHEDRRARFNYGTTLTMRFIAKYSEKVICNSKAISNKMGQYIPAEKLTVVYNGLLEGSKTASEIPVRKAPREERSTLCIAGAIAPHKGQQDAIKVLSLLRERGRNARLLILGLGSWLYLKRLKRLANDLGVSNDVIWQGYLPNAVDVFRSADIVLVCSRFEPFGRVAVEAMSVGTPVIGTNGGGLIEIIDDGKNGLLYPAGNCNALADQIMRLSTDSRLYEIISRNAILSVYERYTKGRYIDEIELIIAAAIEKRQGEYY